MAAQDEKKSMKSLLALIHDGGDITHLDNSEKRALLARLTNYLHLNPEVRNFLVFKDQNGRHKIYATKECCSQLRHNLGINIWLSDPVYSPDPKSPLLISVKANGVNKYGRSAEEIGAVNISNIPLEEIHNYVMFAATKAKRRLTLDLAGLGVLSDAEIQGMINVEETGISNIESDTPKKDIVFNAPKESEQAKNSLLDILNRDTQNF